MKTDLSFWHAMTELIATGSILIDRPKGSTHPRYGEATYPLDYGYLENTTSSDGGGIDVWIGSLNSVVDNARIRTLTGILCTFDTLKRDAEIKLLIECTEEDIQIIQEFHKEMHTLYVPHPRLARI
jgi:inorganic pyrophosphatase